MKTISRLILLVMLMSVTSLSKVYSQGLSLSFNLTETDTLANMIAESKKYDITSLTLSGYVNDVNTSYILDLNTNGNLKNLDLKGCTGIFEKGQLKLCTKKFTSAASAWQWSKTLGFSGEDWNKINLSSDKAATVTLYYSIQDDRIIRSIYVIGWGWSSWDRSYLRNEGTITASISEYSEKYPKLIFFDKSFDTIILPSYLEKVGGERLFVQS